MPLLRGTTAWLEMALYLECKVLNQYLFPGLTTSHLMIDAHWSGVWSNNVYRRPVYTSLGPRSYNTCRQHSLWWYRLPSHPSPEARRVQPVHTLSKFTHFVMWLKQSDSKVNLGTGLVLDRSCSQTHLARGGWSGRGRVSGRWFGAGVSSCNWGEDLEEPKKKPQLETSR